MGCVVAPRDPESANALDQFGLGGGERESDVAVVADVSGELVATRDLYAVALGKRGELCRSAVRDLPPRHEPTARLVCPPLRQGFRTRSEQHIAPLDDLCDPSGDQVIPGLEHIDRCDLHRHG